MTDTPFNGAKLALLHGDELLVYRRDCKPDLEYANCWDLPGGGRENEETPIECALRELHEEFGLHLAAERLEWARLYPPRSAGRLPSWFFAGQIEPAEIRQIRFGDEGQYWQMMTVAVFLEHPAAVPHLPGRLWDYLQDCGRATKG
ncbi:NUDIX hydrolase [Azomonas macrocytogenes]|uniref:8-oxo-dGTP diphosphatase n=1 Tax=Azomonas macrocytogenes TaxID=69962 RepID=A0A839T1C4_AZOMA|nr:NUDIX hydrolase [Azomonas macrocytogenes]MBB3103367.1 8-oxo-dGTP diphosphatase [Azomonas macrocytogenes]